MLHEYTTTKLCHNIYNKMNFSKIKSTITNIISSITSTYNINVDVDIHISSKDDKKNKSPLYLPKIVILTNNLLADQ